MKSEHRHELAENDLEKLLNRGLERIEPWSNQILIGFLVVTVVVAGTIVTMRTAGASRERGWAQMAACRAADDFAEVADEFDGSVVGAWARLRAADGWLEQGVELSLTDRSASTARLEQAEAAYNQLLQSSVAPSEVREQALYGLALTLEANSDGDTGPAIKAYEQLLDEFPQSRFQTWAENRIEELGTGRVQQFYAWFHNAQPKPQDRPLPQDFSGLPSSPPDSSVPTLTPGGALPPGMRGGPSFGESEPVVDPTNNSPDLMPAEDDEQAGSSPPAPPLPDAGEDRPKPFPAPGGNTPAESASPAADETPAADTPAEADSTPANEENAPAESDGDSE
ncbi:MAG: tetratricopeptide repeat protein [Maioricimonas sp. JB049]